MGLYGMAKKEKRDVLVSYDFLPIFQTLVKNGKAQAAAELTIAIIQYDMDGEEPEFTDDRVSFVWDTVIKPKLDKNKEAYNETIRKRKAAGQQGGNAKAENNKNNQGVQNVANLPNGNFANQNNQELPNLPDNDNDIDVDYDVDVDSNNLNNPNGLFVPQGCDEEAQKGKNEYAEIMEAWNRLPVTSIKSINGQRLKMLKARLKDYTPDEILSAISNIRESPFLLGQNKQGWTITFDWFVKPTNFTKVYEGNYIGQRQQNNAHSWNDAQAGFNGAMKKLEGLIDE